MIYILGHTIDDVGYSQKISKSLMVDYNILLGIDRDYLRTGDNAIFFLVSMNNSVLVKFHELIRTKNANSLNLHLLSPDYTDIKRHLNKLPADVKDLGGKFVIENQSNAIERTIMKKFVRSVGKSCLTRNIRRMYDNVEEIKNAYLQPSGLEWDFFGVVKGK